MQTRLTPELLKLESGPEAEQILRNCVHCGFCTATCPTYQLLGDELDGPRGRIYQIKTLFEGAPATLSLQKHLDRCLLCRACETTCPSGVAYGRLLETGRLRLAQLKTRSRFERLQRWLLRKILPYPARFGFFLRLGQLVKPWLQGALGKKIPSRQPQSPRQNPAPHSRRMLILEGCVQSELAPSINHTTARVLDRLGISLIKTPTAGCCGAVDQHLDAPEAARQRARKNIDAWWPMLEAGAEGLVITASGCALMVKEYGHILASDAEYQAKAAKVAELTYDLIEVLLQEDLSGLGIDGTNHGPIAFQSPCTLQHGQKLAGRVESLLSNLGFKLTPVADAHLCCGSAGTYSILQPKIAEQLGQNKARALEAHNPNLIATANIGCLNHLAGISRLRVIHWIELLDTGSSS